MIHEEFVAKLFGTRTNPGSGNQWSKPTDGRNDKRTMRYAFAFDCKATLAASQSVGLEMWEKLVRQSHSERPMLPLRFYTNERLSEYVDLVVVDLNDFHELWEAANGF